MGNRYCVVVLVFVMGSIVQVQADDAKPDFTCFQIAAPYSPQVDIGSDVAIVYGVNDTFSARVDKWREMGYSTSMMTGVAWGEYDAYYGSGDAFKKEAVQTKKDGSLFMHHGGVGYNVPTKSYVEYIKSYLTPAIDKGVDAIFLEEPEFWALSGWSKAFQTRWQEFYNEPWMAPDSSVDAQYRASKLKYEMYFDALRDVCAYIKKRAKEQGRHIECVVPTHSLINYAHWKIVSPESHLMDIADLDGYIAQVWTGTARTPNIYQGVHKERTFETAFFEYGQMYAMVKPTGRKVWFLADPIEDNPNHSWNDYRLNYECTLIASLLWPAVHHFEVMPWPDRIFHGTYPKINMDSKSGDREGIPADYATELLTVINALNDMNQSEVSFDCGSQGLGILVSDTMMFQRANPTPSDGALGSFYGIALPLFKTGVPLEVVQLENLLNANVLDGIKVLFLTYEGQKPLKSAYHDALKAWVRAGGCLVIVGDESDPYNTVREWWNDLGRTAESPLDDLVRRLGIGESARTAPQQIDKGYIRLIEKQPSELQRTFAGGESIRTAADEMLRCLGDSLKTQNYYLLRRGPYVITATLDESTSDAPLTLKGRFVDIFSSQLAVSTQQTLEPGHRGLYCDLDWLKTHGRIPTVVAASARIRDIHTDTSLLAFTARGPCETTANIRAMLPKEPTSITALPAKTVEHEWDASSSTVLLHFPNSAEEVRVEIRF